MSLSPLPHSPAVRDVADYVQRLVTAERTLCVDFDGVDGVGKTTFASHLADELSARNVEVRQASIDEFLNGSIKPWRLRSVFDSITDPPQPCSALVLFGVNGDRRIASPVCCRRR